MHPVVQLALALASIAIVLFVAIVIPAVLQLRKYAERLAVATEELKTDIQVLLRDTREILQRMKEISQRVHLQMDDIEHVIGAVRSWADRIDVVVEEVRAAVERPVVRAARNINLFRTGLATFLQAFSKRDQQH